MWKRTLRYALRSTLNCSLPAGSSDWVVLGLNDPAYVPVAIGVVTSVPLAFGFRSSTIEICAPDSAMKHALSYEQKLKAMRFVPVTSLMTQEQFDRYAHEVKDHYYPRVLLEFPKQDEPKRRKAA